MLLSVTEAMPKAILLSFLEPPHRLKTLQTSAKAMAERKVYAEPRQRKGPPDGLLTTQEKARRSSLIEMKAQPGADAGIEKAHKPVARHAKPKAVVSVGTSSRPNRIVTESAVPETIRLRAERLYTQLDAMQQVPMYPSLAQAYSSARLEAYTCLSNLRNTRFSKCEKCIAYMHALNEASGQYRTVLFMALVLFNPRLRRSRKRRAHMLRLLGNPLLFQSPALQPG